MTDSADLSALQTTLAAEHAAVSVFAVLGGRAAVLGESPVRAALATAYDTHLARRNLLLARVRDADGDPVAAEPAYDLPRPLTTPAQITAEALRVERSCVSTYAALVSVHRTQLAALQGEPPSATAGRPPTLAQIVAREQRAADRFTRWAATSASGDLARVLASIAAGIRMQPVLRGVA